MLVKSSMGSASAEQKSRMCFSYSTSIRVTNLHVQKSNQDLSYNMPNLHDKAACQEAQLHAPLQTPKFALGAHICGGRSCSQNQQGILPFVHLHITAKVAVEHAHQFLQMPLNTALVHCLVALCAACSCTFSLFEYRCGQCLSYLRQSSVQCACQRQVAMPSVKASIEKECTK